MKIPEIVVFPDADAIAREASDRIVVAAQEAIAEKGTFSIALSGGSTPKRMYELLASSPYSSRIDWTNVLIFFGDERCVPPDHPESNFRMANETLLSKAPIPQANVFRMRGEIDPNEAAKEYGLLLKDRFSDVGIDLVLLGLGEDGHTASMFPGTDAVTERHHRVVANYSEHSTTGKSWRITMTAPFLNLSRQIIFAVEGAKKAPAVQRVLEGPRDPEHLPAQLINPVAGKVTWLLDVAAASMDTE